LRYRECEISWVQFRNWLRKNDPENEATATENEAGDNNMEIKKEGKGPMPQKGPEPIPKKNPGETGEVPTPTKTMKPKAPELQTPEDEKSPRTKPRPTTSTPVTPVTPTKTTTHPATKTSSKKKVKKADLQQYTLEKPRRGGV